jgi:hypothetical protein
MVMQGRNMWDIVCPKFVYLLPYMRCVCSLIIYNL